MPAVSVVVFVVYLNRPVFLLEIGNVAITAVVVLGLKSARIIDVEAWTVAVVVSVTSTPAAAVLPMSGSPVLSTGVKDVRTESRKPFPGRRITLLV